MALNLASAIRPWLDTLNPTEWFNFKNRFGLGALKYLRDFEIRPDLLHAAVRYWDPELHVFRIGCQELCPTLEEFGKYLECRSTLQYAIPKFRTSFARTLRDHMGVTAGKANRLLQENQLDIRQIIMDFTPAVGGAPVMRPPSFYFALCLCLLGAFVFVPGDGQVNRQIVEVAVQMGERKNVAPMILAETLLGLDAVKNESTDNFGGCPLALQVIFNF